MSKNHMGKLALAAAGAVGVAGTTIILFGSLPLALVLAAGEFAITLWTVA